jgi:hypothetical protein
MVVVIIIKALGIVFGLRLSPILSSGNLSINSLYAAEYSKATVECLSHKQFSYLY